MTAAVTQERRPVLRPSDATNLAGQDTGRDTLSHSKLAVLLNCQRKYELHYERRLTPIEEATALTWGKAFQKAIEFQDPDVGPMVLDGFRRVMTPEGPVWQQPEPQDMPLFYTREAEEKHELGRVVVRAAAALYLRRWPEGPGETRELEYRVQLRNPWTGHYSRTFDLLGYADGVLDTYPTEGRGPEWIDGTPMRREDWPLELIENKLVGRVDRFKVLHLPLDQQVRLARYGLWRATGRPVARVRYRWIKKPALKQRTGRKKDKSDAESFDAFLERVAADYADPDRADFYAVEEEPTFATEEDLLRTEAELWTNAMQLRQMRQTMIAPRNTTRCADYGGCQFLPVCTGDPDAMSLYRVRERREVEAVVPPEASSD